MGLDISAYKNLEVADDQNDEEMISFYLHNQPDVFQHFDIDGELKYKHTDQVFHFRAGSYSSYSSFKNKLSHFAREVSDGSSFLELIEYSDCEGAIGTACSTKLAGDFIKYQDKANYKLDSISLNIYEKFKEAFVFASDNGVVKFH